MTVADAPTDSRWKRAVKWLLTCRGVQPLRPLGHVVAYYPLLVPGPLLLFAICWNVVLADFDAFHVLWSYEPTAGFLSGAGVAVVLGATLLATFLLDQARNTPPTGLSKQPVASDAPVATDGELPAVRPWAYWALWAASLLAIAAPAAAPSVFFSGAAPFRANDFRDGGGLPVFTAATPPAGAAPDHDLADAQSAMRGARWWFPLGLLTVAALFAASRRLWGEGWENLTRLREFAGWLLVVFATHYALMFVAHLVLGHRAASDDWSAVLRWGLAIVAVGVLAVAGWWVARGGGRRPTISAAAVRHNAVGRGAVLTVAAVVAIGLFAAGRHGTAYCGATGTPVALLGLLGVLTGVAAGISYLNYPRRWYIVLVVVVPFTVPFSCSGWQTEYRVPGLDGRYDGGRQFPLDRYGEMRAAGGNWEWYTSNGLTPPALVPDREAIRATAGRPLVVVAVSGGASASAQYTADILFTLEAEQPGFIDRVRVVTGASGGMLAGAYFVSAFRSGTPLDASRDRHRRGALPTQDYQKEVRAAREQALADLGRDFLGPLVQRYVYLDTPLYFFPRGFKPDWSFDWGTTNDRGLALEQAWRLMKGPGGHDDRGVLHVPLADLRKDELAGKVPSLIFAPMMIEDGRQLFISNLDLDYMVDSEIPTELERDAVRRGDAKRGDVKKADPKKAEPKQSNPKLSHTALEYYRMFPDPAAGQPGHPLRLSTAARLNASFPFFSPSAAVPTEPRRHVVDGGYFDNYGTLTATKWIAHNARAVHTGAQLSAPKPDGPAEIVLLQIHCFAFEGETRAWVRKDEESEGKSRPAALHSLAAPVIGALASRRAQMVYRGDERRDAVNRLLAADKLPRFERLLIECEVGPSLNWALTPDTRRQLRRDVWQQLEEPNGDRRLPGVGPLLDAGTRLPR